MFYLMTGSQGLGKLRYNRKAVFRLFDLPPVALQKFWEVIWQLSWPLTPLSFLLPGQVTLQGKMNWVLEV